MRRHLHPIPFALATGLASLLIVLPGPAAGLDEDTLPLSAVQRGYRFVFASTPEGLYRASLADRRWQRLETSPEMPPDGKFAAQPGRSSLVVYVATKPGFEGAAKPRPGLRYGLYLSRDDGATWELRDGRGDLGVALLMPDGVLFAAAGSDGFIGGAQLLRSTDLGRTWSDVTGEVRGQIHALEPDPAQPGRIRIQFWWFRDYTSVADGEDGHWKVAMTPPDDDGFARSSYASNRYHSFRATLGNYFLHDFGDSAVISAIEIVPGRSRFVFARGEPVVIPLRVEFHHDPAAIRAGHRKSSPHRPPVSVAIPAEKFADRSGSAEFWGLRVEAPWGRFVARPDDRRSITIRVGGPASSTAQRAPALPYRTFDLSPTTPYTRDLDLGSLADFDTPGEYRVQIRYDSGGHPEGNADVWDGGLSSPVFTVVIRE